MPQRRRTLFCVSGQVIQRLCRMRQSGMADPSVLFMLERPIPGLNHLRAFESEELADIVYSEGLAGGIAIDSGAMLHACVGMVFGWRTCSRTVRTCPRTA
jgi:hypothetical protein